jgi:hypothetical protein
MVKRTKFPRLSSDVRLVQSSMECADQKLGQLDFDDSARAKITGEPS